MTGPSWSRACGRQIFFLKGRSGLDDRSRLKSGLNACLGRSWPDRGAGAAMLGAIVAPPPVRAGKAAFGSGLAGIVVTVAHARLVSRRGPDGNFSRSLKGEFPLWLCCSHPRDPAP